LSLFYSEMPRFKESYRPTYIAPKAESMCLGGVVGTETSIVPLHSHSLRYGSSAQYIVRFFLQSVWRSVGSNAMVAWFGCLVLDGQRHCLAYSFMADSSLSWVVVSPSYITWMCSGRGIRTAWRRILGSSSIRVALAFEHDGRMGTLANFVVFRRLSNI
jgi:hypothetical protein